MVPLDPTGSSTINLHEFEHIIEEILLPGESIADIRSDMHRSEIWADIFWRRKTHHANRKDPDIDFITQFKPQSILEIGSAYGRVTHKICDLVKDLEKTPKITGIEICTHFAPYFDSYMNKNHLMAVETIYDDFLTTDALLPDSYDLVILPMTTIASFVPNSLSLLLSRVNEVLKTGGVFIFSNYKLPMTTQQLYSSLLKDRPYNAEILPALDTDFVPSDSIIAESYQLEVKSTDYGASTTNIITFTKINRTFELLNHQVFCFQTNYYVRSFMIQIIEANGGEILEIDDTSHSTVYIAEF